MQTEIKNKMVKLVEKVMVGETISVKEYLCGTQEALFIKRQNKGEVYGVTVVMDDNTVWLSNHSGKTERSSILLTNPFNLANYVGL
jgi:membrane-bound inhibitor of C-type lysozyme